jgi:adenylosuccinate synthase
VGEEIRKIGSEFGATTGRPRRCGWIDLVALKYACMINGVTQVVMTKADVLDAFEELQVCTAYGIDGATTQEVPFQMSNIEIEPVLQAFKGWNMDTTQLKLASELPATMNTYVDFINNYIGAPVTYVSNGPGREQIVKI